MANWDNLKSAVSAIIRENGNQEITGTILQQTLLSIITNVGANATFAGIATPTTNPGTPDGPVFWLASGPGIFSNFSNAILEEGHLYVLQYINNSWASLLLYSYKEYIDEKEREYIEEGGTEVFSNVQFTEEGLLNLDGTFDKNFNNWFHTDFIDLKMVSRIKGWRLMSNGGIGLAAALYDIDKSFINGFSGVNDIDILVNNYQNARYIVLQSYPSTHGDWNDVGYSLYVNSGRLVNAEKNILTLTDKTELMQDEIASMQDEIASMIGFKDKDITEEANWIDGYYFAQSDPLSPTPDIRYNEYIDWSSGRCTEIDVTNYTSLKYINALSTNYYVHVGYLIGDGHLLLTINGSWEGAGGHTDNTGEIDLSQYKDYAKLIFRVNACRPTDRWPSLPTTKILVSKSGIHEYIDKKPKKIVLNGDSLCNQLGLQLMNIAHSQGYDLLNRTRGGENIIGNLTRTGGMLARVNQEFTMPASGSVTVSLCSAWMYEDGSYAKTPYNWTPTQGESFWIKGVKGNLHKLKMVAIIAYDSSKNILRTYKDGGNYTMPLGTAYIRININAENTSGEPHVSINDIPLNVTTLCNISGYIDEDNTEVTNTSFKHSDYVSVSSTNLYFDGCASPDSYVFERNESGEPFKVGVGTECYDNRLVTDKDYPHIWFSGQNMGYQSPNEYAEMTDTACKAFNANNLIVTTHTTICDSNIVKTARKYFGDRYLNIRDYLTGNAVFDAMRYGLISGTHTANEWETLFLDSFGIHQNDVCAYIEALQMWNRMVALGMVEGSIIDGPEYFVTNAESKIYLWYDTPEDGYGPNFPNL